MTWRKVEIEVSFLPDKEVGDRERDRQMEMREPHSHNDTLPQVRIIKLASN